MQSINSFDQSDASIRLLLTLSEFTNGLGVMELHAQMMQKWGIGRGATDTARNICEELKLIEWQGMIKNGPRAAKVFSLTEKGRKMIPCLKDIQRILEE